jgi:RNA-directed DNA polymerase
VVKPRVQGEAYLVRSLDDFVVCFQLQADTLRVQEALRNRLGEFGLTREVGKTQLTQPCSTTFD